MKTRVNWTKETIEVVTNEVRQSPDNLSSAFKRLSKKLNVSPGAVMNAWYTKIRNMHPEFATGSENKVIINRKNSPKRKKVIVRTKKVGGKLVSEKIINVKEVEGIKIVTKIQYYI